jgi:hypothetical protein
MSMWKRGHWWLGVAALVLEGCNGSLSLPGGYAVQYGDRGKAWLANPDGTMAHGAVINQLYSDGRNLLLISFAAVVEGAIDGPRPRDGNCYIALLIDSQTRQIRQVRLNEAKLMASRMKIIEDYQRECLKGMPIA